MIEKNSKEIVIIKEKSIIKRILNFWKRLFNKNSSKQEKSEISEIKDKKSDLAFESRGIEVKPKFKEELRKTAEGEVELKKLQQMFQNGDITEEEMTNGQVEKLMELYDSQIKELERRIKNVYKKNYNIA